MNGTIRSFFNMFKTKDIRAVKSPLRICPLGAHVDHQGGMVTGMALDSSVNMIYTPADNRYIRIQSLDFPDEEYFNIEHVPPMIPGFWGNYIRGAVLSLQQDYVLKRGINAIISGKLPIGGLSSSAAVTTAYLMALCDVNEIEISKIELIQYSHWVETNYIGLKNGILDQSANILSRNGHLMFIDCNTNEYKLIKKSEKMPEFEVIVVYSGISKALIGTDYNNRVDECKVAGWILQDLTGSTVNTLQEMKLRDIPIDMYIKYKEQIPGRFKKRAEHFFSEMDRVQKGITAWKEGDIYTFGNLMFQSGESSIYQYECGCPELITIYEILRSCEGVYGARFSGAGYRGCCIGLIDPKRKDKIKEQIDLTYPVKHPKYKDLYKVYFCKTSDGAHLLRRDEIEVLGL